MTSGSFYRYGSDGQAMGYRGLVQEALLALRSRYGITCPAAGELPGITALNGYSVEGASVSDENGDLLGLWVTTAGRFGNALLGFQFALSIAEQFDVRYLRFPDIDGLIVETPKTIGGITILSTAGSLPPGGAFLKGPFDTLCYFPKLETPSSYLKAELTKKYVRPVLNLPRDKPFPRELVIHLRSGDIFSTYIHSLYVQPPLSFYQLVVTQLIDRGLVDRVRLVFEDRLNPCVDALESWLQTIGVQTAIQCEGFIKDLGAMIDASYFCFGLGSLGPAVCLLSEGLKEVYHFQASKYPDLSEFSSAEESIEYCVDTDYIRLGTWANTPEQRERMLTFPANALHEYRSNERKLFIGPFPPTDWEAMMGNS